MKKILKSLLALSLMISPLVMANQVLAVDDTNQTESMIASVDTTYVEYEYEGAHIILNTETEEGYDVLDDNTLQLISLPSNVSEFTVPDHITAVFGDAESGELYEDRINTYTVTDINLANVSRLTKIKFPETIQKITSLSGSKITQLNIPDSVTEISEYAFIDSTALEEVHLSSQLKRIEAYTFSGCTYLNRVDFPSHLEYIGEYAFYKNTNLKSIDLPDSVTEIGDYAFEQSGLEEITLPENLTTLGDGSFFACYHLEIIQFGANLTTITQSAFRQCFALENIIIPEGITTIEDRAFESCFHIKNIELPSTLTSIGMWTFALSHANTYSSQLQSIQYKYNGTTDGTGLPSIHNDAFKNNGGTVDLSQVTLSIRIMNETPIDTLQEEFRKKGFSFKSVEQTQSVVAFQIGNNIIKESMNKGNNTVLPDVVTKEWYRLKDSVIENTNQTIKLIENEFTITYHLSGGNMPEGAENPTHFKYTDRNKELVDPVQEGCEFMGWYEESASRSNARIDNVKQLSAGNKTLIAKWAPLQQYITDLDIQTIDNQKPSQYTSKYYTNKGVKITFKVKTIEDSNLSDSGDWYYGNFVAARNDTPIGNTWNKIEPNEENVYTITLDKPDKYIIKFKNNCEGVEKIHDNVIEVVIDNVAPKISFHQPENQTYFGYLFNVSEPTKNDVDGEQVKIGYGLNYVYINDELVADHSDYGMTVGVGGPLKISGLVDKDTLYTVKAIDKAGNSTTETVTLKAVPDVDDVTLNAEMLKTIGDIEDEFVKKVESGFFDGEDDLKNKIESRIVSLKNRYDDLVLKAPLDKIIELSSTVTKENVTTSYMSLLKELKQQLIEKYEAIDDKDNYPITKDTYEKELKRIDDVIAYHESVMEEYNAAILNAEKYIKNGCHLGNLEDGKVLLTSLETMLKENLHNYTAEEVAKINQNIISIRNMIESLQSAKDELQEYVDSFTKLDAHKYTSDSYAKLKEVYDDAMKALNDNNSTTEVLNEKIDAFEKQMSQLKANETGHIIVDNNHSKNEKDDEKKETVETSDRTYLFGLTCGLLVSAGVIAYLSRKKKEFNR